MRRPNRNQFLAFRGGADTAHETTAKEMGVGIAAQQKEMNSLAPVMLRNHIVLDRILADQGGVCVLANTISCVYINSSAEVKTHLYKIRQQATWLEPTSPEMLAETDRLTGLFCRIF